MSKGARAGLLACLLLPLGCQCQPAQGGGDAGGVIDARLVVDGGHGGLDAGLRDEGIFGRFDAAVRDAHVDARDASLAFDATAPRSRLDTPIPIPNLPPRSGVHGDLDGDGAPDAFAVEWDSNAGLSRFRFARGRADRTFEPPVLVDTWENTNSSSWRVEELVDWNADGLLDVVIGEGGPSRIYLSRGDGTFTVPALIPMSPDHLARDMNGDGFADALFVDRGGQPGFTVGLSQPDGTFATGSASVPGGVGQLVPADLDGDGLLELVMLGPVQGHVEVFRVASTGFVSAGSVEVTPWYRPTHPQAVKLGLRGREGVVFGMGGIGDAVGVVVLTPNDLGGVGVEPTVGQGVTDFAVADIDADGHADIVVTTANLHVTPASGIAAYFGDGTGRFSDEVTIFNATHSSVITAVTDIDRDGLLDVVIDGVHAYLGAGGRGFRAALMDVRDVPTRAQLVPLHADDDGWIDMLEATEAGMVRIRHLGAGGVVTSVTDCAALPPSSSSHGFIDQDSDGFLDRIYTASTGTAFFQMGTGPCTFAAPTMFPPQAGLFGRWLDVNGDTLLDLIRLGDGTLTTWLATGPGQLGTPVTTDVGAQTIFMTSGDFDGDGKADVATMQRAGFTLDQAGPPVAFWLGRGDGTFFHREADAWSPADTTFSPYARAADLDGDLRDELFVSVTSNMPRVELLRLNVIGGVTHEQVTSPAGLSRMPSIVEVDGAFPRELMFSSGEPASQGFADVVLADGTTWATLPTSNLWTLLDADSDGDVDMLTWESFEGRAAVGVYLNRTVP